MIVLNNVYVVNWFEFELEKRDKIILNNVGGKLKRIEIFEKKIYKIIEFCVLSVMCGCVGKVI